jgi:hypothetical protein
MMSSRTEYEGSNILPARQPTPSKELQAFVL